MGSNGARLGQTGGILAQWKEIMARRTDNEYDEVCEAVDKVEEICNQIIREIDAEELVNELSGYKVSENKTLPRLSKL